MARYISHSLHALLVSILLLVSSAFAFNRTIGPTDDRRFTNASKVCQGGDPANWKFGACSLLIDCVYDQLSEAFKASLDSGTNIASLLPTILVLIGLS